MFYKRWKFFVLLLVSMVLTAGVMPAQASLPKTNPAKKAMSLVVGAVGVSDIGMKEDGLTASKTCQDLCNRVTWAFSINNPNKKFTARNVRVRLLLKSANGGPQVDTILTVASSIPPRQTVWVTPTSLSTSSTVVSSSFDPVSTGAKDVAAAEASIVNVQWTKKSSRYLGTVEANVETQTYIPSLFANQYLDRDMKSAVTIQASATVSNPRPKARIYSTWVMFDAAGNPIGGVRFATERERGATDVGLKWLAPASFSSRIARVVNVSVPR
jgi:hypothetical protein